jgi:DNA polymerase-3 subunit gamma/tau
VIDHMRTLATTLGPHRLSAMADVVSEALQSMTGATSPRLHLELLMARLLLDSAPAQSSPQPVATAESPPAPAAEASQPEKAEPPRPRRRRRLKIRRPPLLRPHR